MLSGEPTRPPFNLSLQLPARLRKDLFREGWSSDSCVEGFHKIQNDLQDSLLADRSINHGVVNGTVRPFHVEILVEEIDAFPINRIHELFGIFLAFAAGHEAPQFILSGSIKKHPQRVLAVPEKLLRPSSDDDGVSCFRGVLNDTFRKFQNAFGINQVELVRIEASFIAAAQERFEEPVVQGIRSFLATLDNRLRTFSKPRDLFRQQLIPELPAQVVRNQLSDFAAAASVFAFDGDSFDHLGRITTGCKR